MEQKSHSIPLEELIQEFSTDIEYGLTQQDAEKRLKNYGFNELPIKKQDSWLIIFLRQFANPLIYILLIAASIIFFVGEPLDAFVISGILFFNAVIGAIQEGRTAHMLAAMRTFLKGDAQVMRDGETIVIDDRYVAPGDILLLREGEKVCADARLIEVHNLSVDESMLTGESEGIEKNTDIYKKDTVVADRKNMVHKGTYVLSGTAKALVVATGTKTEMGAIGKSIEDIESDMPLKKEIDRLSRWILVFIFFTCIFLFIIGLLQGRSIKELLIILTALFICVIPEGLPIVLTLSLVTGAYRMAHHNIVVKRLQAAEGLGRADIVVIDKTGTLTRNEMMVTSLFTQGKLFEITGKGYEQQGAILFKQEPIKEIASGQDLMRMYEAITLLCTAQITFNEKEKRYTIKGDPTEAAMLVAAGKMRQYFIDPYDNQFKPIQRIPFKSETKFQAGIFERNGELFLFLIGAPEVVFEKCLSLEKAAQEELKHLLDAGYRVIACAYKKIQEHEHKEKFSDKELAELLQDDFMLLGALAMEDNIRQEVPAVVERAKKAGLKIIMATGDHKNTALFVAKKTGIFKEGDRIITGQELIPMSDEELVSIIDDVTVFSRVSPTDKVRIIKLLQKRGSLVGMTGDGVNDAPSLIAADLGIAMGGIGTEVAKAASDLIVLDDAFSSVIHAVEQGRYIFRTLRRVISYFFITNMVEVILILCALMFNITLPLLAVQILWLNLVTDGFLDVALAMEPIHPHADYQTKKIDRLIDINTLLRMIFLSIPMAIGALLIFLYYEDNVKLARTMTLTTIALYQWMNAWNCRSERMSVFQLGLFSNRWLIIATTFVLLLQICLVYTYPFQFMFRTVPLSFWQWALIISITLPLFILEECRKVILTLFKKRVA